MIAKFKESLLELTESRDMHPASESAPSVLLAVSGGIDSMCMAYLFSRIFYSNYAIATINFSLRGEESNGDEELVHDWARNHGIRCFSTTFDTNQYAAEKGISTQMAARDLRYNWFEFLMKKHSFDYLAIAHNLNDSVETFFINALRGTGIQGLAGIRKKNGYIIRPLLGITRREIAEFVKQEDIPFREDSSNAQSHYARNRLRNLVFPEFEMINHSFLKTIERGMGNVEAAADVLQDLFLEKKHSFYDETSSKISIEALLKEARPDFWLYEILSEYGFNPDQIAQVNESLNGQSGKEFHSESFLLIKDRDFLLLYPKGGTATPKVEINKIEILSLKIGQRAQFECCNNLVELLIYPKPKNFAYKKKKDANNVAMGDLFANIHEAPEEDNSKIPEPIIYLDADLIQFPLILRDWQDGDKFIPLGMKGSKKLSDFMVDLKLDIVSKTQIPILLSGDKIAAVIGYRIDERFKITPNTLNVLELELSRVS